MTHIVFLVTIFIRISISAGRKAKHTSQNNNRTAFASQLKLPGLKSELDGSAALGSENNFPVTSLNRYFQAVFVIYLFSPSVHNNEIPAIIKLC